MDKTSKKVLLFSSISFSFFDYHLVYVVAFLKTCFPHEDESQWDADHLISEYRFIEKRTKEFAPPTIFITFVELGRFTKGEAECHSERDKVFYWFNNSCMAEEIPSCASDDPEMQSLVEATRIAAFPPEKKNIYNRDIMKELDIKYSEKKKFEAGLAQGREEGAANTKHEIARAMKAKGFQASEISEITGLSAEAIAAL